MSSGLVSKDRRIVFTLAARSRVACKNLSEKKIEFCTSNKGSKHSIQIYSHWNRVSGKQGVAH